MLFQFLRQTPVVYQIWLAAIFAWFVFVTAELVWSSVAGHPFWPVTP